MPGVARSGPPSIRRIPLVSRRSRAVHAAVRNVDSYHSRPVSIEARAASS
jgi:hypothetical protein